MLYAETVACCRAHQPRYYHATQAPACHLHGIVVITPNYKSVVLGSNLSPGSRWIAHPAAVFPSHLGKVINGYLGKPEEGKQWEPGCYNGPVVLSSGCWSSTVSVVKAKEMSTSGTHSSAYGSNFAKPLQFHPLGFSSDPMVCLVY